ncbi:MAG TPA: hypothetical protein PKK99_03575 [Bacteroidia bacterium]|nr:hypothetical protein [Bacteroidia bacterium]HNP98105.1 hypothetical protein [Bacteroidia bacterium]
MTFVSVMPDANHEIPYILKGHCKDNCSQGFMISSKKKINNKSALSTLKNEDLVHFRTLYQQIKEVDSEQVISELHRLQNKNLSNLSVLQEYHNLLLFCLAYPRNERIRQLALEELERIKEFVIRIYLSKSLKKKIALSGSGISGSTMTGSFSFELVQWLLKNYPESIRLDGLDTSENSPVDILKFGLLEAETDLSEKKDLSIKKWLLLANGKNGFSIASVLEYIDSLSVPQEIRDFLYETLKVFIDFDLNERYASLTFGHISGGDKFYQINDFIRKPDITNILNDENPKSCFLNDEEKQEYVNAARMALFLLFRETDPVTFANTEATEVVDCGRGFKIALFHMRRDRRLALDSYVGYMAFKNGQPCAYGGGWIFRNKSKIGINIFPPYRGGESAWIFAQILRAYKNKFNVRYLEAEPYQIGKNNPEGIQSGAFWFYYRIGFRPVQKSLQELAEKEWNKLNNQRSYRSPAAILKKLAESTMCLDCEHPGNTTNINSLDAQGMGKMLTQHILELHHGQRREAKKAMWKKLVTLCPEVKNLAKSKEEKHSLELLYPIASLLVSRTSILVKDKKNLLKWLISKSDRSENVYIEATQNLEQHFTELEKASE